MQTEKLSNLVEEMNALTKKMKESGSELLKNEVEYLFEKHPQLQGLYWTQYTPYWNDGEECIFRIGEVAYTYVPASERKIGDHCLRYCEWTEDDKAEGKYEEAKTTEWFSSYYTLKNDTEFHKDIREFYQSIKSAKDVLDKAMEEGLVVINRVADGTEIHVHEYEHD